MRAKVLCERIEQWLGRQDPLGPAAFESELGSDLFPPVADVAQHHVVRNENFREDHFVEVMGTGQ
jgi:hypothetical protein